MNHSQPCTAARSAGGGGASGFAVTLALAGEAIALAVLARRQPPVAATPATDADVPPSIAPDNPDPLPFAAAIAFLGASLAHALTVLAPPAALVEGLEQPLAAAIALGAVAVAAARVASAAIDPDARIALHAGAAVVLLYLASVLLVTPFQPGTAPSRQQGQAL